MSHSQHRASEPLQGVFPICATPFTPDDRIDMASLERLTEYIVGSGVPGLVYPAIASEFQTLADEERQAALETVGATLAGRRALIVGVSSSDVGRPPRLAREASGLGAAAIMLMPPAHIGEDEAAIESLFSAVADNCECPIILQNAPKPMGAALPTHAVLRLVERVPQVRYVKEETPPCGHRISALVAGAGDGLLGVFGGAGGRFLMDELARGAAGSMPACELSGIHLEIYTNYRAGRLGEARRLFNILQPLLSFESVYRTTATKHILHRLGIIECSRHRDGNFLLDDADRRELAVILAEIDCAMQAEQKMQVS